MTDSGLSGRRLIMHAAHKTIGVSAAPAALRSWEPFGFSTADDLSGPLRVCLVCAAATRGAEESLAALERDLADRCEVECSRLRGPSAGELADLAGLETSDCMLLLWRQTALEGGRLQRIRDYCRLGGAIVGVRSAGCALQDWLSFDKEVFGADYLGHHANRPTEVRIVEAVGDHPILLGVEPFTSEGSLQKSRHLAEDATVLLWGKFAGYGEPVAWTRTYHGGRVFYTSLGHPEDFGQPAFLRLLANALRWTANRPR
ncbi:MAG: hypothetical protein A2V70_13255 [Planctomycetes bacterium RBG_13_63_9]|nr:MAG: hypothetical protein A2V70_13255 [Planctomycetes bacterium RBG_13_63_9]